jgi:hypothetical protein
LNHYCLTLLGLKAELLTTNGGLVHQTAFCVYKYGHSFSIARFYLFSGGRPGTRTSSSSLGTRSCLDTGSNRDSGCGGIKLEITAGEFIVSTLVLKKNNFAKYLTAAAT